ncbi:unnamed protein product [Closterium sp. NIES-53]
MSLDGSSYARGNQQQPTFAPYEPQRGSVSLAPQPQPSPGQEKTLDALQRAARVARAAELPYNSTASTPAGVPRPYLLSLVSYFSAGPCSHGYPSVLTFDAEGRAVDFEVWLDDLQLFLQCDRADGLSLFDLTSGVSPAPPATADSTVRSQWATCDAAASLAVRRHLPTTERAHFSQYRSAQTLYDAVVARYSSPATAALSRLFLPYLFPDLATFPTVADLITHLRTSDTRYRAALPAEFCAKDPPPLYLTLYYVVTRLPDSLCVVRDHFLSVCPTTLTVDLLEERLLAAEQSIVAIGASRGDPRTPIFEGCPPSPLLPSVASAATADLGGFETTLAALGFAPSTDDPSLFLRTDTSLPPFYVVVYVDDLVFAIADTAGLAHVKSELQKRHTCTDLGELRSYLGLQITRDRAQRTITLTQSHMVQQVLQRFDFTYSSPQATPLSTRHSLSALPSDESVEPSGPYPELVGCLMYVMTCTRPDLAYPLSILARYVAPGRHRPEHMATAKRVLRYLCSTSGMGLVLGGRRPVVLTGHAWADDQATQRSSQGYTFSLGSGSVSWRSTSSSSVLSSSCEAEIYAGAMAAQELRWLTYLLTDLGEQPRSPPVLYVDNKAMLALCREHRLEHRTKHIALRYFLARELQQRGELRLAYVASEANTADIFTEALAPGDHQRFCTLLEGLGYNLLSVSQLMAKGIHLQADSSTQEFKLFHGRGGLYIGRAVLKNNVFVLDFVPDQGTADSDAIVNFAPWMHPPDLDPDFSPGGFLYSHTIPEAERTRALATIRQKETTSTSAETTSTAAETTSATPTTLTTPIASSSTASPHINNTPPTPAQQLTPTPREVHRSANFTAAFYSNSDLYRRSPGHRASESLWHERLGHPSNTTLNNTIKAAVLDKDSLLLPDGRELQRVRGTCFTCPEADLLHQPFASHHNPSAPAYAPLEKVYSDILYTREQGQGAYNYVITFIDAATRYVWHLNLPSRDMAFEAFVAWLPMAERESGAKLKSFQSDGGGEYQSQRFRQYLATRSIKRLISLPYAHQQQGVAERMNRTLQNTMRKLLRGMRLPNHQWPEAMDHAVMLHNLLSSSSLPNNASPHLLWTGKLGNTKMLRVFGCMVQYRPHTARAGRFSQRAQWGLHLGIERHYNAWKIFYVHSKETVAARDVIFYERLTLQTYLDNLAANRDLTGGFRGNRAFASAADKADWDEQNVDNASEEARPLPYCSVPIPMNDENPRESVNVETYFDFADTGYVTPQPVDTNISERIGPNFLPDPEAGDEAVYPEDTNLPRYTQSGLQILGLVTAVHGAEPHKEPAKIQQALGGEHREKWHEAMDKELKAL